MLRQEGVSSAALRMQPIYLSKPLDSEHASITREAFVLPEV